MKKIENKFTCINCNNEYLVASNNSKYCSKKCTREFRRLKKYPEDAKEGYDYLTCHWDNKCVGKYMSQYISTNFPERTYEEYKMEFPYQPNIAPSYAYKISVNSGKHMSDPYYKKMFSEKISGNKNPNSKKNTTLLQRQHCSKFSKEYWKKNHPELNAEQINERVSEFAKESIKDRLTGTQLQYWVNKCNGDIEKAKLLLKDRQTTFSLEKCISKYGETEGKIKWINRQEKWFKSYRKSNFSRVSQVLFKEIYNTLTEKFKKENDIYFATLNSKKEFDDSGSNNEFTLKLNNTIIKPDFFILNQNKIIEFDGTYYHRKNPENKKREEKRDIDLLNSGYNVLHVSEYDNKINHKDIIQQCIEFINN